jgi:hypothetical protein
MHLKLKKVLNIRAGSVAGQNFGNLPRTINDIRFGMNAQFQVGVTRSFDRHDLGGL